MKEAMRSDGSDVSDVEHLIVPISAFFGPVYRPLGSAEELRKSWSSNVTVGMLAVVTLVVILALAVGFGSGSADDPAYLFEHPVLFWSFMFGVLAARWTISAVWVFRHRSRLERTKPRLTLDERLVANHGPASLSAVKGHAMWMGMLLLFFLVPALLQMETYPWIFGPMALMFGVQAWSAFRVYRLRAHRAQCADRSRDSSTPGASSR